MKVLSQVSRLLSTLRLRPFDTSTSEGRSQERYRRAALTTIASGIAKAIGLLTSLVSVPLTFRYLGAERYGIWMVLISLISVMGFADLGIGNGLINAISEAYGKDDRRLAKEYVTSALFLMLGISVLLALAGAATYPFLPWQRLFNVKSGMVAAEGARAFLVLYCWFVVNIPLGVITRAQTGLQLGYSSQIIGALGNVISLLAMLLVIFTHGSLASLVLASTFGVIIATLLNGWLLFRKHPWLMPDWDAYRKVAALKILKLGLMFFVLQCAIAIGFTSDNIVITQVLGAAAVAAYAVPQKLFSFTSMLVSIAIAPLWPAYGEAIARGDVAWVRKVFLGSLATTLAVTIPVSVLLVLAGPWILMTAVGKSFHASLPLLVILGLWAVVSSVSTPMAMLLNGAGVIKIQTLISTVASLTNLALSVFLTRRLGVVGVCLGSIITQVLIVFSAYFFVIRKLLKSLRWNAFRNSRDQTTQQHLLA
jgi:O-antigen/teichoic acid export membrane protein